MTNQFRILLLKLTATLAALFAGGCNLPSVAPQPVAPAAPQKVIVEVKVQDGKLIVNDATINVAQTKTAGDLCPCCGTTRVCQGLCGKPGCNCSSNEAAAVSIAGNVTDLPQFVTQYRNRIVCENGVCRTIREAVQVPVAAGRPPVGSAASPGRITVYWQRGNPASEAMRDALKDVKGIDWETSQSPLVNGNHWYPTAYRNGQAWVPFKGWDGTSAASFRAWSGQ